MRRMLAWIVVFSAGATSATPAQPPADPPPPPFTLRPAAEPRPALKYRLVPERLTLVPGNAAVFYHRGVEIAASHRQKSLIKDREKPDSPAVSTAEQVNRWSDLPASQIPRDQALKVLEDHKDVLKEVELGATRSTCDWEYDRRDDGIYLMIEEIQGMRGLARLVALKARLLILDGKTDEAMHWIETGLVMARHVSQGPIAIQSLVGVSISFAMSRCLEELIQAPGTPSLFWALANRPRPFIDLRYPLEGERHILEKEFPAMAELGRGPWSVDQARKLVDDLQRKLFAIVGDEPITAAEHPGPIDLAAVSRRLRIAAMCVKIYPDARKALIAEGRPEAEVEAMPVVQVALLHTHQEYQRLSDDIYKWMGVPYWQSYDRIEPSSFIATSRKDDNPLLALFGAFIPAINAVRLAPVRLDRQLDTLQCIEAIRLHAAAHEGKLPADLAAITEAPVPLDPATGKPFEYKLEGETAVLSAPAPPGSPDRPAFRIRHVLKLAR